MSASAATRALLDLDNDSTFFGTNEDVTAYTRGGAAIHSERGRDKARVLAPPIAGSLTFRLDNQDRRFSYENTGSPLYGSILPGRATRALTSLARDDFNRANDATGLGTAPQGGAWQADWGVIGVSSSKAYPVTYDAGAAFGAGTGGAVATLDTGSPDGHVEVYGDTIPSVTGVVGLVFRAVDASNFWVLTNKNSLGLNGWAIWKVVAGIATIVVGIVGGPSPGNGQTLHVEYYGPTIRFWIVAGGTVYASNIGTDTTHQTATRCGVMFRNGGGASANARLDVWRFECAINTCYLRSLAQHPRLGDRYVEMDSLGVLSKLVGKTISTALYAAITTETALGYLLDAAGLTGTSLRVFDTGKTTLDYWWLDNEDAFTAALAILNTEGPGASLYEDAWGRIVFESRHYRVLTSRSTTPQATFSDSGSEPLHDATFTYDPGVDDVINVCTYTVKKRSAKSIGTVWTLGETVTLAAGETRDYQARDNDGNPFTAAVCTSGGGDFTTTGTATAAISGRTSGGSVTVRCQGGASGGTVLSLRVRAQLVSVDATVELANLVDTSVSQGRYGTRAVSPDARAEISVNVAQSFANAIVGWYQEPRPTATFTLTNANETRLRHMLTRQISDRITGVEAHTGLDGDLWIEAIAHQIGAGGLVHKASFACEKVSDVANYAIVGDAIVGTDLVGF